MIINMIKNIVIKMYIYLSIAIILLAALLILKNKKLKKSKENGLNIEKAYQKQWMFTYNKKNAHWKLKEIADELGYILFAKVRLFDLVKPRKGIEKYQTYLNKIQAKHVDFVLCDQKLVARYIIELDDSSHDTQARKERDEFVDKVVESVGYKIIHTRAVTDDIKKQITPLK